MEIVDPTVGTKPSNLAVNTSKIGLVLNAFKELGAHLELHRKKFGEEYEEHQKTDPSKVFRYSKPNLFLTILP